MSIQTNARKKPTVEDLRPKEEETQANADEAVIRALDMYLRQQAFTNPVPLPRWVTW
jgi:hypothetical protein